MVKSEGVVKSEGRMVKSEGVVKSEGRMVKSEGVVKGKGRMPRAQMTRDLLAQPARLVAPRIARQLLRTLERERARLERAGDEEALHDFRVALRRLRSWLRAFQSVFVGRVHGTSRRALRDLAHATNDVRDAEVLLAWLAVQPGLAAGSRPGADALAARIRGEGRAASLLFARRLRRDFERTARRLERELASDPAPGARRWAQAGPVMGTLVADLMGAQALELEATLRRVHSLEDGVDAHRARIAGKRLRYLLEPFAAARRSGVIERLQRFQDALGEWQDARVLLTRIGSERAKVERRRRAGGSRDPRIGLDALATRARERLARAFTAFDREWLRGRGVQRIFTALRSFSKSAAPGVSPREL